MNNRHYPIILILVLMLSFASIEIKAQQENTTLKVLCYNLRFGELANLKDLGTFIKSENPDIVMLQEVDIFTQREKAVHQNGKNFIAELGYYTEMMSAFGKSINYKGGYYGLGILSKYPILSMQKIFLPLVEDGREQRSLLIARIELDNGLEVTVASTHLDLKPKIRLVQVAYINEILSQETNPVILAGDFNAKPGSPEISVGMKNWKKACNDDLTTSSKNPGAKIDYIFCYPENSWNVIDSKTSEVTLSDHFPVISVLELIANN